MNVAARAREVGLRMEVKKDGLPQLQDGSWVLKVKVHPNEIAPALLTAPMGTRYMAVLVEINDNEEPVSPEEQAEREKPKRGWDAMPLAQQAGIRCNDEAFWRFLEEQKGARVTTPEQAADQVRGLCNVHSRADLQRGTAAGNQWQDLNDEYQAWMAAA